MGRRHLHSLSWLTATTTSCTTARSVTTAADSDSLRSPWAQSIATVRSARRTVRSATTGARRLPSARSESADAVHRVKRWNCGCGRFASCGFRSLFPETEISTSETWKRGFDRSRPPSSGTQAAEADAPETGSPNLARSARRNLRNRIPACGFLLPEIRPKPTDRERALPNPVLGFEIKQLNAALPGRRLRSNSRSRIWNFLVPIPVPRFAMRLPLRSECKS